MTLLTCGPSVATPPSVNHTDENLSAHPDPGWWSATSTSPIAQTRTTVQTGMWPPFPACLFLQVLDLVSPAVPVQALNPASPRACCPNNSLRSETWFANTLLSTQKRNKAQGLSCSPHLSLINTFSSDLHVYWLRNTHSGPDIYLKLEL